MTFLSYIPTNEMGYPDQTVSTPWASDDWGGCLLIFVPTLAARRHRLDVESQTKENGYLQNGSRTAGKSIETMHSPTS